MNPLIFFMVKACLIANPVDCTTFAYLTDMQSKEQCQHRVALFLPQIVTDLALQRPDLKFAAFACASVVKSKAA